MGRPMGIDWASVHDLQTESAAVIAKRLGCTRQAVNRARGVLLTGPESRVMRKLAELAMADTRASVVVRSPHFRAALGKLKAVG